MPASSCCKAASGEVAPETALERLPAASEDGTKISIRVWREKAISAEESGCAGMEMLALAAGGVWANAGMDWSEARAELASRAVTSVDRRKRPPAKVALFMSAKSPSAILRSAAVALPRWGRRWRGEK